MIQIELAHEDGREGEDWYCPGELLVVKVRWQLPKDNCELSLQVLWETEGKGTDESEAAHEMEWESEKSSGEQTFEVLMPRGPVSLDGNMLKIRWYVDCYVEALGIKARKPLVLSTTGATIRLPEPVIPAGMAKVMKLFGMKTPPAESNPTT